MNYNVTLTFILRISFGLAYGMWSMSVISAYIYILGGDSTEANEMVGYAQAIEGTFVAAAALPMGWLASKVRRDRILKFSGVVSIVAIAATVAAVTSTASELSKYYLLCLALAFWGITEAASPILDSLFADSVPTGQRSGLYTIMFVCTVVTQGLGPLLASAYFYLQGNTWTLATLQTIMLAGMAVSVIPTAVLFLFDDSRTLGVESEGLLKAPGPLSQPLLSSPAPPDSPASPAAIDDNYFYDPDVAGDDEASPSPLARSASPTSAHGEDDEDARDAMQRTGSGEGAGRRAEGAAGQDARWGVGGYRPPAFVLPGGYHKHGSSGDLRVSPHRYLESVQEDGPLLSDEGGYGGGLQDLEAMRDTGEQQSCHHHPHSPPFLHTPFQLESVQEDPIGPAVRTHPSPPAMLTIPPTKLPEGVAPCDPTTGGGAAVSTPPGTHLPTNLEPDSSPEGTSTPSPFPPALALQSPEALALLSTSLDALNSPSTSPPNPKDPYAAARTLWCIQPTCDPSPTPLPRTFSDLTHHTTITIHPGADSHPFPPPPLTAPPADASSSSGNPSPPSPYTHQLLRTPPAYLSRPRYLLPSRSMDSLMLAHTPRPISIPPTSSESDQPTPTKPPPSFTSTPNSSIFGTPVKWEESPYTPPFYKARVATWVSQLSSAPSACLSVHAIPAVLAVSDCISGLASGMTVKFFPIFFKEAVHLPPTQVSLIFALTPLALSLLSLASRAASTRLGRIQTMLLFRLVGIALIFAIALHPPLWALPAAVIPMFIVRTAAMNCCYPLQKSVLMDFVPKETRARWNSLEALTAFGWSGSAAAGGLLLSRFGFATTFTITACMQLGAWSLLWLLVPLVPRDEAAVAAALAERAAADVAYDVRRASQEQQRLLEKEQAAAVALYAEQLQREEEAGGEGAAAASGAPQAEEEAEGDGAAVRLEAGGQRQVVAPFDDVAVTVAPEVEVEAEVPPAEHAAMERTAAERAEEAEWRRSRMKAWRGGLGLRRSASQEHQLLLQAAQQV